MSKRSIVLWIVLVVGGSLPVLSAGPAAAVNLIPVNSTMDGADLNDGKCTLREALESANTDSSVDGDCNDGNGTDTIIFSPTTDTHAITLSGPVDIFTPMTITGNGRTKTIVTGGEFRTGPGTSTIEHLSLVDVNNDGGTVHMIDVKASSDEMSNDSASGNVSIMTITGSSVKKVTNDSGATPLSLAKLTITSSTTGLIDNYSGSGTTSRLIVSRSRTGEIDNNSAGSTTSASITNTTIKGTTSYGVDVEGTGTTGTIFASTISGFGKGVFSDGKTTKIVNSTITGNTSESVAVGAGTATVVNSTLTNSARGVHRSGGTIKLTNSILAGNSARNCIGKVASGGGNISDDASCHFHGSHDHNNRHPRLGRLANNGGPTRTQRPLRGSPAIDGGLNGPCPARDQRGVRRPRDGDRNGTRVCDVGSVEVVP